MANHSVSLIQQEGLLRVAPPRIDDAPLPGCIYSSHYYLQLKSYTTTSSLRASTAREREFSLNPLRARNIFLPQLPNARFVKLSYQTTYCTISPCTPSSLSLLLLLGYSSDSLVKKKKMKTHRTYYDNRNRCCVH